MNGRSGSFFVGLIIGTLVGMVLALLLTPQSGEETRELINEKVSTLRKDAEEAVEKARASTEGIVGRSKDVVQQVQARIQTIRSSDQASQQAEART